MKIGTIVGYLTAGSLLIGAATTATVYARDQVFLIEVGADYATSKIMDEYYNLCAQIKRFQPHQVPTDLRERAIAKWDYINSIRAKRGQDSIKSCHG